MIKIGGINRRLVQKENGISRISGFPSAKTISIISNKLDSKSEIIFDQMSFRRLIETIGSTGFARQ